MGKEVKYPSSLKEIYVLFWGLSWFLLNVIENTILVMHASRLEQAVSSFRQRLF